MALTLFMACSPKESSVPIAEQKGIQTQPAQAKSVPIDKAKFDSDKWRSANLLERRAYIEDIYLSKVLIDNSRQLVQDLLGPADGEFKESHAVFYRVDSGSTLSSGKPWMWSLIIYFDDEGKVRQVKIST